MKGGSGVGRVRVVDGMVDCIVGVAGWGVLLCGEVGVGVGGAGDVFRVGWGVACFGC